MPRDHQQLAAACRRGLVAELQAWIVRSVRSEHPRLAVLSQGLCIPQSSSHHSIERR